jgi:hypothetical protein
MAAATVLTDDELYNTFRAYFPGEVATAMTAIALRESGGNPEAYNGPPDEEGTNATGDRSYGLVQINLGDANVAALMASNKLDGPALLTPAGNALGAYLLWGGRNSNLNLAWYIDRAGTPYQTRYEGFLPRAQAAALRFTAVVTQGTTVAKG